MCFSKKNRETRTTKINSVFALIACQNGVLEEKETRNFKVIFKNSGLVVPTEHISNSFVEDLKSLAALAA